MSWWTSATLHPKTKNRFVVVFSNVFYLPNVKSISKPEVQIETKEYRLLNHTFNYPGNAKWQPVTVKFVDMNGIANGEDLHFDTSQFLWQMLNNTGYAYPYFDESAIEEPMYRNVIKAGEESTKGHHIATKINFRDNPRTDAKEFETWRTITTPEKSSNIANSFGLGLEGEIDNKKAGVSRQRVAIYQISPDKIINEAWYLVNPIVKSINWGDLAYEDDALTEYELQIVYDWAILDRQVVGTTLVVDEEPYKEFMKTLKNNKETVIRELREAVGLGEERFEVDPFGDIDTLTQDLKELDNLQDLLRSPNPVDLNGDGILSDEEKALWENNNGAGIEQLREEAAAMETEIIEARKDLILQQEEEQRRAEEELAQAVDQNLFADAGELEDDFTVDESLSEMEGEGAALEAGLRAAEEVVRRREETRQNLETIERLEQEKREEILNTIIDAEVDQNLQEMNQQVPYDPSSAASDEDLDLQYNREPSSNVQMPEDSSDSGSYSEQLDKEKEELEALQRELAKQRFSETETD